MRYQQLTDYEIQDNQTGLVWRKRMEVGTYKFDRALSEASLVAEETGQAWRVPTVEELLTLWDSNKASPASTFPGMPPYGFWSSSPYVGSTCYAWLVSFYDGGVFGSNRYDYGAVRLVRNAHVQPNLVQL